MQSLHLIHQCVTLLIFLGSSCHSPCICGSLMHKVEVKCYPIGRWIYIPERNFLLILIDGLDVMGPEGQSPGPVAFSECSECLQCEVRSPHWRLSTDALTQLAEVQATVLFSLLWIRFHGEAVHSTLLGTCFEYVGAMYIEFSIFLPQPILFQGSPYCLLVVMANRSHARVFSHSSSTLALRDSCPSLRLRSRPSQLLKESRT